MMDNSKKLEEILALITSGEYFVINRPRQYGKTTTLFALERILQQEEEYFVFKLSFETVAVHENEADFAQMFWEQMQEYAAFQNESMNGVLMELGQVVLDMKSLSLAITKLQHRAQKKLVLLIDEVDASSNYEPFLSFLAMLRNKYLDRSSPRNFTFHSIVLAGVHDIKSLKYKLRHPEEAQYNSPWNIAVDFKVEMAFYPKEIVPMLEMYCQAEGVQMNIPVIAERLYYHTSGYPFLVSKLCKNIAEDILPQKADPTSWTLEDVETAVQLLLKENNTNFDSLIKNLENNEKLYQLVYEVLLNGVIIPFNPDEPVTQLGRIYGILKDNGRLKVHNRIYEQRIYNYMAAKTLQTLIEQGSYGIGDYYVTKNNTLDMEQVLRNFQSFMKEQRSSKDLRFLERHWRLVFLSFLRPILNGKGYDFKEVETAEEKRLDIVATFYEHKYIIELKLWRGEKSHERGLGQLATYLDFHSADKGYLLIFDDRENRSLEAKTIRHHNKEIFAVWI